jgi:hypothetical protein
MCPHRKRDVLIKIDWQRLPNSSSLFENPFSKFGMTNAEKIMK